VSVAIIREVELEPYRRGPTFLAAWDHVSALMVAGLALVAACWGNGLVRRRPA